MEGNEPPDKPETPPKPPSGSAGLPDSSEIPQGNSEQVENASQIHQPTTGDSQNGASSLADTTSPATTSGEAQTVEPIQHRDVTDLIDDPSDPLSPSAPSVADDILDSEVGSPQPSETQDDEVIQITDSDRPISIHGSDSESNVEQPQKLQTVATKSPGKQQTVLKKSVKTPQATATVAASPTTQLKSAKIVTTPVASGAGKPQKPVATPTSPAVESLADDFALAMDDYKSSIEQSKEVPMQVTDDGEPASQNQVVQTQMHQVPQLAPEQVHVVSQTSTAVTTQPQVQQPVTTVTQSGATTVTTQIKQPVLKLRPTDHVPVQSHSQSQQNLADDSQPAANQPSTQDEDPVRIYMEGVCRQVDLMNVNRGIADDQMQMHARIIKNAVDQDHTLAMVPDRKLNNIYGTHRLGNLEVKDIQPEELRANYCSFFDNDPPKLLGTPMIPPWLWRPDFPDIALPVGANMGNFQPCYNITMEPLDVDYYCEGVDFHESIQSDVVKVLLGSKGQMPELNDDRKGLDVWVPGGNVWPKLYDDFGTAKKWYHTLPDYRRDIAGFTFGPAPLISLSGHAFWYKMMYRAAIELPCVASWLPYVPCLGYPRAPGQQHKNGLVCYVFWDRSMLVCYYDMPVLVKAIYSDQLFWLTHPKSVKQSSNMIDMPHARVGTPYGLPEYMLFISDTWLNTGHDLRKLVKPADAAEDYMTLHKFISQHYRHPIQGYYSHYGYYDHSCNQASALYSLNKEHQSHPVYWKIILEESGMDYLVDWSFIEPDQTQVLTPAGSVSSTPGRFNPVQPPHFLLDNDELASLDRHLPDSWKSWLRGDDSDINDDSENNNNSQSKTEHSSDSGSSSDSDSDSSSDGEYETEYETETENNSDVMEHDGSEGSAGGQGSDQYDTDPQPQDQLDDDNTPLPFIKAPCGKIIKACRGLRIINPVRDTRVVQQAILSVAEQLEKIKPVEDIVHFYGNDKPDKKGVVNCLPWTPGQICPLSKVVGCHYSGGIIKSKAEFFAHYIMFHSIVRPEIWVCTADRSKNYRHFRHNRAKCEFWCFSLTQMHAHLARADHGTPLGEGFYNFLVGGSSIRTWTDAGASTHVASANANFCADVLQRWLDDRHDCYKLVSAPGQIHPDFVTLPSIVLGSDYKKSATNHYSLKDTRWWVWIGNTKDPRMEEGLVQFCPPVNSTYFTRMQQEHKFFFSELEEFAPDPKKTYKGDSTLKILQDTWQKNIARQGYLKAKEASYSRFFLQNYLGDKCTKKPYTQAGTNITYDFRTFHVPDANERKILKSGDVPRRGLSELKGSDWRAEKFMINTGTNKTYYDYAAKRMRRGDANKKRPHSSPPEHQKPDKNPGNRDKKNKKPRKDSDVDVTGNRMATVDNLYTRACLRHRLEWCIFRKVTSNDRSCDKAFIEAFSNLDENNSELIASITRSFLKENEPPLFSEDNFLSYAEWCKFQGMTTSQQQGFVQCEDGTDCRNVECKPSQSDRDRMPPPSHTPSRGNHGNPGRGGSPKPQRKPRDRDRGGRSGRGRGSRSPSASNENYRSRSGSRKTPERKSLVVPRTPSSVMQEYKDQAQKTNQQAWRTGLHDPNRHPASHIYSQGTPYSSIVRGATGGMTPAGTGGFTRYMPTGGSAGACGGSGMPSGGYDSDDWNKTDTESERVQKMRQIQEMSLTDQKAQFKDIQKTYDITKRMSSQGIDPQAMLVQSDRTYDDDVIHDDQTGINEKRRLKQLQKADAAGANIAHVTGIVNIVQASGSNIPGGKPKPLDGTIPKASSTLTKSVSTPGPAKQSTSTAGDQKSHGSDQKSHNSDNKSHGRDMRSQAGRTKTNTPPPKVLKEGTYGGMVFHGADFLDKLTENEELPPDIDDEADFPSLDSPGSSFRTAMRNHVAEQLIKADNATDGPPPKSQAQITVAGVVASACSNDARANCKHFVANWRTQSAEMIAYTEMTIAGLTHRATFLQERLDQVTALSHAMEQQCEKLTAQQHELASERDHYKALYEQSKAQQVTYSCDSDHLDLRNPCYPPQYTSTTEKDNVFKTIMPPDSGAVRRPQFVPIFTKCPDGTMQTLWVDPVNHTELQLQFFLAGQTWSGCTDQDPIYSQLTPSAMAADRLDSNKDSKKSQDSTSKKSKKKKKKKSKTDN